MLERACADGDNAPDARRRRSRRALRPGARSSWSRWRRLRGRIRPTVTRSTPTTTASATTLRSRCGQSTTTRSFVGTIGSFTMEGEREVTYRIAAARWGQGPASRALRAFLATIEQTRPIYGRVAEHNAASAKVLVRAGFREVGLRNVVRAGSRRRRRRAHFSTRSLAGVVHRPPPARPPNLPGSCARCSCSLEHDGVGAPPKPMASKFRRPNGRKHRWVKTGADFSTCSDCGPTLRSAVRSPLSVERPSGRHGDE